MDHQEIIGLKIQPSSCTIDYWITLVCCNVDKNAILYKYGQSEGIKGWKLPYIGQVYIR